MVVNDLRIAQLMYKTTADFENRKRVLQRKETTDAYRKTAQYQSPKNPMLEALENLLSGKTEKELHHADEALRKSDSGALHDGNESSKPLVENRMTRQEKLRQPEVKQEIRQLEMTEQEVIKHEQAHKSVGGSLTGPVSYTYTDGPDDRRYIYGGEVPINVKEGSTLEETLKILKRVHEAALASSDPSSQDLRVAASAVSQMQQVRGEIATERYEELNKDDEQEPYADLDFAFEVPNRFLNDFANRDANENTLFGQELERYLFERTFTKATAKYSQHIAMVKNGYRSFDEPSFSRTA